MTAKLILRPYQKETIEALFGAWKDGMRRPAVVLPTGAGKTVVFAELIRRFIGKQRGPLDQFKADPRAGHRVIVLVHRDELADQAIGKIRAAAPDLRVGKVKADDNDIDADVMVCSVQTLARPGRRRALVLAQGSRERVGLIISDECHHAPSKSWLSVFDAFPDALHAGFTATLERGDGVGLGSVWDDVVYSRSPLWMMKHGYLVQPRAFTEDIGGLDLGSVKRSGGDYASGDLGRALEESDLASTLPAAWREHGEGRSTVVFTPTVATAHGVRDAFREAGIPSDAISGGTSRDERLDIFERHRTGAVKVLVNCMVLTEGWDAPWTSCAVIARPTRSRPLYLQMVGRVLRPWPGKTDAVVLNVAGAGGSLSTLADLSPGEVREVREGEGLLEAEDREELEAADEAARAGISRRRLLHLKEVKSLFESSSRAWLSTAGGVMFLSVGEWTYFLWPSRETPGTWNVCRKPQHGGKWERTQHTGLPLEMAKAWAEAEAEDHGSFSVSRKAAWRRGPASEKQMAYAATLGVAADGMSKAQLSDAISYVKESRALDPYIGIV